WLLSIDNWLLSIGYSRFFPIFAPMNFNLSQIPERIAKPRQSGLTMVMDKGLSVEEARNFMSATHPHVDMVKLGFGTSFVTPNLKEKIEVYHSYGLPVYFGGPFFVAFLLRGA